MNTTILQQLEATINQRKASSSDSSYVSALLTKGRGAITQKVGEEAIETIIASLENQHRDEQDKAVIAEMADLWFHCLVLLAEQDLSSDAVLNELERRFGRSGLDEKASRVNN